MLLLNYLLINLHICYINENENHSQSCYYIANQLLLIGGNA